VSRMAPICHGARAAAPQEETIRRER